MSAKQFHTLKMQFSCQKLLIHRTDVIFNKRKKEAFRIVLQIQTRILRLFV